MASLELRNVLNLWLVLRYQDGSRKIIQNCSTDLVTASLSPIERFRAEKTKFHFEDDESESPVDIIYSSQSRQACEDFVSDTILATDDDYFQNRQNTVPDIRDVVTDCLNPLATSMKFLEKDMQRLQEVVNSLHEMNIEKFWSEPLNIDGDINVRPQLAENGREESENGQKSKKRKKKKAKKVEEVDESSIDTTPGPPSLSGLLISEKNGDEEKIEYTLKKFGENLKSMGEVRKRSSFKHPDPIITAFCVFRDERNVKFQSVKKVPDEKNTFKATILTNKLPAYEVAFVKNEKCVEVLRDTDSEAFDTFKDIFFCTAVVSAYPPDYFANAEVFVMGENGLMPTKEKPRRGVRYVVKC